MNKIKISIIIVMLFSLIATKCSAITTIDENSRMYILEELEAPYHYLNEEKADYKIRSLNGNSIYALGKYDDTDNEMVTSGTQYVNAEINHILENGYPMQMESTLGCINWQEAYLATQEAIYCKLENKNINNYIAENESGERIINAMKKILKAPKRDVITLEELTDWNSLSDTEKCKEYEAQSSHEIRGYGIKIIEGNAKNIYRNDTKFRLVIPKNTETPISINVQLDIVGTYVQKFGSKQDVNIQYVMPEVGILKPSKEFNIRISDATVTIQNKDEYDNLIKESSFDVLDSEYHTIKENLQPNDSGKLIVNLDKGMYYLKQTSTKSDYEINKGLIPIDIREGKDVNINVTNTSKSYETITTNKKEVNTKEETKEIKEINTKDVTNIFTTNINKEIINQISETNLNNVNHFINTINRKTIANLKKEKIYKNWIDEIDEQNVTLDGETVNSTMTRSDYMNRIDMLMYGKTTAPILPVASK